MSQATIEKLQARLNCLTEHADAFEEMFGSRSDEADEEVAFYRDVIAHIERLETALGDIVGHGVLLPAAKQLELTDGEWRWYVRGLDSQRQIAADALATPNEEQS